MNILVAGNLQPDEAFCSKLKALGFAISFQRDETAPTFKPYLYKVVICNNLFQHNELSAFANLETVQLTSAGLDRVPIQAIEERGIRLFSAKDVYSIPIAETVILGILRLYKRARFFSLNQSKHVWEKNRELEELTGKRCCIIGTGSSGTAVAERLSAFGAKVIGVNRTVKDLPFFQIIEPLSNIDLVLPTCDVVVLTIANAAETAGMLNEEKLSLLKPGAIIVNVARGGVLNEKVLIDRLQSGEIAGAVLDVFDQEPLSPTSPLWDMHNVIITPHNAFASNLTSSRLQSLVIQNLESVYGEFKRGY